MMTYEHYQFLRRSEPKQVCAPEAPDAATDESRVWSKAPRKLLFFDALLDAEYES